MKNACVLIGMVALLGLAGCAGVRKPVPSGFLGDYAEVTTLGAAPADSGEASPAAPGRCGIQIDPVVFAGAAAERPSAAPEGEALREKLDARLRAACATRLAVATEPGEGVVRLRTAVTAVRPSEPVLNAATMLLLFAPVDMGGIAVEFELVDSVSGRRIAAAMADRDGRPWQPFSALRRTGHAEAVFGRLASSFLDSAFGPACPHVGCRPESVPPRGAVPSAAASSGRTSAAVSTAD